MEFTELVRKALEKDEKAINELYNLTVNSVYKRVKKHVKNDDDIQNILQDTYFKAFSKLNTLKEPEKFQYWLNRIASNECCEFYRKNKNIVISDSDVYEYTDFSDVTKEDVQDFSLDSSIDYIETKEAVLKILEALPEEQKTVVIMFYFEDLSIKDISEILNISENTVKSRLNYAKKKIKTEIEELEKKEGKIFAVAPIPLFIGIIKKDEKSMLVSQVLKENVIKNVNIKFLEKVPTSIVKNITKPSFTMTKKIISGFVMLGLAVGGAILVKLGVNNANNEIVKLTESSVITTTEKKFETEETSQTPIITKDEVLEKFNEAYDFYLKYVYGRDFDVSAERDMSYYNSSEGELLKLNGSWHINPVEFETYEELEKTVLNYFTIHVSEDLLSQIGAINYNGKCYINVLDGIGSWLWSDYEVDVIENEDGTYSVVAGFTAIDDVHYEEKFNCVYENGNWVFDNADFYAFE